MPGRVSLSWLLRRAARRSCLATESCDSLSPRLPDLGRSFRLRAASFASLSLGTCLDADAQRLVPGYGLVQGWYKNLYRPRRRASAS